jgi:hypothetical protein
MPTRQSLLKSVFPLMLEDKLVVQLNELSIGKLLNTVRTLNRELEIVSRLTKLINKLKHRKALLDLLGSQWQGTWLVGLKPLLLRPELKQLVRREFLLTLLLHKLGEVLQLVS